jgi:hypothetical protein
VSTPYWTENRHSEKVSDQVDALSTERIDNVLDTVAADADASTDAIHPGIVALQGELAAVSGLARDGLDLDASRTDLGHLLRKEASDGADVVCHGVASRGNADTLI